MTTKQELLHKIEELQAKVNAMPDDKRLYEGDIFLCAPWDGDETHLLKAKYDCDDFLIEMGRYAGGFSAPKPALRNIANWFNDLADKLED